MIAYRDAAPADGPALAAMARATWTETFAHSCSAEDLALYLAAAYGPDGDLPRHLVDPAYRFHLAVEGDAIAGYVKMAASTLDERITGPDVVKLDQLYVAKPWQGTRVAATLMDWAIATARAAKAAALVLTVWEENDRARRFYERRGFVHVGDYAFRTGNQIDRDLILRLAL